MGVSPLTASTKAWLCSGVFPKLSTPGSASSRALAELRASSATIRSTSRGSSLHFAAMALAATMASYPHPSPGALRRSGKQHRVMGRRKGRGGVIQREMNGET